MSNNTIANKLDDQSAQLSFARDLLQIFVEFLNRERPTPGKNTPSDVLAFATNSELYESAITTASEKLLCVINELDSLSEEIAKPA